MSGDGLDAALILGLRELLDAERIMFKVLARSARASRDEELRLLLNSHLQDAKGNTERVKESLKSLGVAVRAKTCRGMAGIEAEGFKAVESGVPGPLRDSLLILNARKAEHYGIATYETLTAWTEQIEASPISEILADSLTVIRNLNEKLAPIARRVSAKAGAGGSSTATGSPPDSGTHDHPATIREV